MNQNRNLAWALLILLAIIWGSSFILMKKSLGIFTVNQVASMRIFSAFIFFLPIAFVNLQKILSIKNWWPFIMLGLLGNLLPAFCFALAGSKIDSSLSGVLNSLTPLFTLVIGALFFGSILTRNQILGMLVGFAGAVLLVFAGNQGSGMSFNPYAFLVFGAALMYGMNTNLVGKYVQLYSPVVLTTCLFLCVGPMAAVVLFSGDFVARAQQPEAMMPLIYSIILGVLGSGVAMILYNWVVRLINPLFGASVTYLIPIVAVVWGVIDGEHLYLQHYLGMVLILAGVFLVNQLKEK